MFSSCLYEVYVRYLYYTKQQKTKAMQKFKYYNEIITYTGFTLGGKYAMRFEDGVLIYLSAHQLSKLEEIK